MGRFNLGLGDRQLDELITEAQGDPNNDSLAMGEIVRRFDRLAVKVASRLTGDSYLRDELANSARVALMAAVRRHDTSWPGFPAYARTFMRGAALRAWKRSQSWGRGGKDITVMVTRCPSRWFPGSIRSKRPTPGVRGRRPRPSPPSARPSASSSSAAT